MVKAVVGANWGDEGKGKVTDMMAKEADVVIRFQGGANAGHTIVTHLLDYGNIRFEMGYASAIAAMLFVAMIVCKKLIQKMLSKVGQ